MTRYNVLLHHDTPQYLAACYEPVGNGIRTTLEVADACSWVMPESAARVARHISETLKVHVSVQPCSA